MKQSNCQSGGQIHIDVKSDALHDGKGGYPAGHAKKSLSRKIREESRREMFFREKDNKKKHPVSSGTAAAYKKRKTSGGADHE